MKLNAIINLVLLLIAFVALYMVYSAISITGNLKGIELFVLIFYIVLLLLMTGLNILFLFAGQQLFNQNEDGFKKLKIYYLITTIATVILLMVSLYTTYLAYDSYKNYMMPYEMNDDSKESIDVPSSGSDLE
jgi:heme/copper-type cytochrome/quinol oxidase subunit 2